jgi:hypothetical protein
MGDKKKFTILHSNDMHGDFLAEMRGEPGNLIGGLSLLSGYINRVRHEEKNVLYCIAGDMVQGSLIDAEYKGISTMEIMNYLAPDIVTLGTTSSTMVCRTCCSLRRWLTSPSSTRTSTSPSTTSACSSRTSS